MYSLELHFTRWCSIYFSRQNALPSLGKTNEIFVDIALAHKKNLLSAWFVSIAFFLQKNLTIHIRPAKYIGCCEYKKYPYYLAVQIYKSILVYFFWFWFHMLYLDLFLLPYCAYVVTQLALWPTRFNVIQRNTRLGLATKYRLGLPCRKSPCHK